jgi:ketosteroid isomerase-like protein
LVSVATTDIELVKSAFDAWNRGSIDAFTAHMSDDVAWVEASGRPEGEPTERLGRERLRLSLASLFDAFESYRLEVEQVHELGDRVVAVVREIARGRSSGVEVDGLWGYLITVTDGRITRIEAHRDADVVLEMADRRGDLSQ